MPAIDSKAMGEKRNPLAIKAIQTKWRGRHYRSRLEARWAVFFDTLGISFNYEPEGYQLPDGTCYLPDFWLPEVRWFAEVKPFVLDSSKAYPFVAAGGGAALMLDGEPGFRSYTGFDMVGGDVEQTEFSLDTWTYRKQFNEGRLWAQPDYEAIFTNVSEKEDVFSLRYRAAIEASLSARFGS